MYTVTHKPVKNSKVTNSLEISYVLHHCLLFVLKDETDTTTTFVVRINY